MTASTAAWAARPRRRGLAHRGAGAAPVRRRGGGARRAGAIVEIGSFRGRSAIVLRRAPAGVEVVCIDPHAGSDRGPQEIAADADRGEADHEAFRANLARAGVAERVRHVRALLRRGAAARSTAPSTCSSSTARTASARPAPTSCAGATRVRPGGRMLVHDAFSSVGVTLALLTTTRLRAAAGATSGRDGLAGRVRARATRGGAGATPLRQLRELPWFARNVVVKALILARVRRGPWPY